MAVTSHCRSTQQSYRSFTAQHVGQAEPSAGEREFSCHCCCLLHSSSFSHKQYWNYHRVLSKFLPAYNMALCSLCSTLPFNGFPAFSPRDRPKVAGDDEFVVVNLPEWTGPKLPDPIGFPFHENLSALAESAKTCSLCAVIQAGVQAWLVSWDKVAGTKKFVQGTSPYPFSGYFPLEERLWLTEISPETPGFCVWTEAQRVRTDVNDGFNFYLLTMVGFSAEERRLIPGINLTSLHVWLMMTCCSQTAHSRTDPPCDPWTQTPALHAA